MRSLRCIAALNIMGVIVLLVGIGSARLVIQRGQPPATNSTAIGGWQDSSLALMDSKTATRNIELYGGKVEVLMVQALDWLQRPAVLAILIALVAVLLALGCFLTARHLSAGP